LERAAGLVRRLLRAAGAPVPRARRSAAAVSDILQAYGVTRREADILTLLAAGLTNADIAGQLYLSVRTVEGHVSSRSPNSAPATEPTLPPATWNCSDAKDGNSVAVDA
jgi:FixJ family two-component response regulator